jgi:hypothetical protein
MNSEFRTTTPIRKVEEEPLVEPSTPQRRAEGDRRIIVTPERNLGLPMMSSRGSMKSEQIPSFNLERRHYTTDCSIRR